MKTTTTRVAAVLMAFSVFACGKSVPSLDAGTSANDLTAPDPGNPRGGVRDPSIRPVAPPVVPAPVVPAPVVPVVPVGGVRDPSVRPVAPRPQ